MKISDLKEGDYFREKENHRGDIWCLVDGLDTHRDCSAAWPVSGDSPYWFDHDTEVVRMIPNWTEEE